VTDEQRDAEVKAAGERLELSLMLNVDEARGQHGRNSYQHLKANGDAELLMTILAALDRATRERANVVETRDRQAETIRALGRQVEVLRAALIKARDAAWSPGRGDAGRECSCGEYTHDYSANDIDAALAAFKEGL
jgi:hypothetical protein